MKQAQGPSRRTTRPRKIGGRLSPDPYSNDDIPPDYQPDPPFGPGFDYPPDPREATGSIEDVPEEISNLCWELHLARKHRDARGQSIARAKLFWRGWVALLIDRTLLLVGPDPDSWTEIEFVPRRLLPLTEVPSR